MNDRVFVTKFALTHGIQEYEVVDYLHGQNLHVKDNNKPNRIMFLSSSDWFSNRADAIAKAEEMRIKAIQSLDIKIKKLSAKKFT